jgi:cytochrome c-type biogenesis protein CcmE
VNATAKLLIVTTIAASSATWLAYSGASASWQYYLTIDECLEAADSLVDSRLRVSGRVAAESLEIADDRSEARFRLQGSQGELQVRVPGPLPDNLAEDMEVVVEGTLASTTELQGTAVLTRCASKYEPQTE